MLKVLGIQKVQISAQIIGTNLSSSKKPLPPSHPHIRSSEVKQNLIDSKNEMWFDLDLRLTPRCE